MCAANADVSGARSRRAHFNRAHDYHGNHTLCGKIDHGGIDTLGFSDRHRRVHVRPRAEAGVCVPRATSTQRAAAILLTASVGDSIKSSCSCVWHTASGPGATQQIHVPRQLDSDKLTNVPHQGRSTDSPFITSGPPRRKPWSVRLVVARCAGRRGARGRLGCRTRLGGRARLGGCTCLGGRLGGGLLRRSLGLSRLLVRAAWHPVRWGNERASSVGCG